MAQEYKIKGLLSLDLKSGEKREVEIEGIENGKVLLAKVGDKTHATSANCTHYGAPLKLGVLTPDGRLTCAWHGGESFILYAEYIIELVADEYQPASILPPVMSRMPRPWTPLPNSRLSRKVEACTLKGKRV